MQRALPFEKEKRKVTVKKNAETSPDFGCRPIDRPVKDLFEYGIVNINKPRGPTSHQVSDYVQKILGIEKAGHSGTLDPNVTGVLPIALGNATRVVQNLLLAGKEYIGIMRLHKKSTEAEIKKVMASFVGTIKQLPPIKSAVKRVMRERTIYYAEIIETDGKNVLFKVGCQAGTYIRKLCHDFGEKMGCGAHMAELLRTKAGPFRYDKTITLQDLRDAVHYYKESGKENFIKKCILPVEDGVGHLKKVWVLDTGVDTICHGANLALPGVAKFNFNIKEGDTIAVMTLKDELICVGTSLMDSKKMSRKNGISIKTGKVFMPPGTYPKIKK